MNSLFSTHPRQSNSSSSYFSPSLSRSSFCGTLSKRIAQTKQLVICDTPCVASLTIPQHVIATPKYALGLSFRDEEEEQDDQDDQDDDNAVNNALIDTVRPVDRSCGTSSFGSSTSSSDFHAAMLIRNTMKRQGTDSLSESKTNPSRNSAASGHGRSWTSPIPVQIPKQNHGYNAHHPEKGNVRLLSRRQHKHVPLSDTISSSVAALLAITDIPRPHRTRRPTSRSRLADDAMSDQDVSEKALSISLNRGPLDLLLSPPEELVDDDLSPTESNLGSLLARTVSADSVSSLSGESCATETCSSIETPRSINIFVRRRSSLVRRSLEPVRSPPDATEEHPLASADVDADVDDFELELPFAPKSEDNFSSYPLLQPFKPLRTAFKSNLTASLRALKSAAKSFSSINFSYIPADDFLTRSILTIDPNVPYMDERRPPVTEEMPSAELRRYLNPTTSAHFDPQPKVRRVGTYSASIQLQTYKIQRSRSPSPSNRTSHDSNHSSPSPSSRGHNASNNSNQHNSTKSGYQIAIAPAMRQREMRENPDFIRIAVMEMAMRRRGKLDSQKPGRARWALPPRRPSAKPYEVGSTGIPTRWIPVTY
ncbi:hypothetical protein E4U21_005545 [Claviceps maximensis]|nr:hypothetical protein E4U21_005545 [Claviceps maximensis]